VRLIVRILVSGAAALLVIALVIASGPLSPALVQFFLYPGVIAASIVYPVLYDLQLIPPPAPGEGFLPRQAHKFPSSVVCSLGSIVCHERHSPGR
jgi:hypothetical protein